MRPTLPTLSVLLLLLAVALAGPARAEDEPPATNAAADAEARAAEAREAEAIGRGLLSSEEDARRQAVERLLARVARGGDLAAFLDALSRANRAWADRHERLMEVWLHDAVHGSAADRERAVRLLTALGEQAIRRLALELRHARLHEGAAGAQALPEEAATAAASQAAEPADLPPPEIAIGTPRVYDLRDLFARGMNAVELRGLLLKTADAVEVKQFKTQFVVTAAEKGHDLLCNLLSDMRLSQERTADAPAAPTAPADAGQAEAPAGEDGAPVPADAKRDDGSKPAPVATQRGGPVRPRTPAGSWQIEPTLIHIPRGVFTGEDRGAEQVNSLVALLGRKAGSAPLESLVRALDAQVVDAWTKVLRQVPDARAGLALEGETLVAAGGTTQLFAGRSIRYSQDVRRTKGGAWTIVTGTIEHGIGVELALFAEPTLLRVELVVTRTDVGLPIPVVRFQPSAQAASVELERPEWSRTRLRRSFDLPLEGGGVLLSLDGLGDSDDDQLILTMKLTPPAGK